MIAIKGIFDGKSIRALENIPVSRSSKVIITFLDANVEDEEMRNFTSQEEGFDFWNNDREDLYQDYLSD